MENILKYVIEEALVMIPVLWVIAEVIKRLNYIESRWIPLIILSISLAFSPWLLGGYTPQNLVQAVLVAGGEMLLYQVVDKTKGGDK